MTYVKVYRRSKGLEKQKRRGTSSDRTMVSRVASAALAISHLIRQEQQGRARF